MPVYAKIEEGVVTGIVTMTSQPAGGYVDVTSVSPQPQVGWITDGSYETWTAPAAGTAAASLNALATKAQAALTNNETYLGIGSPTNAQVVSQVAALTRQVNALIRLAINQLDSTTGT